MSKKKKDFKLRIVRITSCIIFIIMMILYNNHSYNKGYEEGFHYGFWHKKINIDETINLINKECGGTHITKKFGSDEWMIFKQVCKDNGYCKFDYINLNDCLN